MATKTQLGAVIGMSGANQYITDMKALTQVTKQFAAETKSLEASFEKHGKTIEQMASHERSLKTEQEALTNQLRRQREELEKFNSIAAQNPGGVLTNKQLEGFAALQTDIANTEAELNRVNQELDNMPSKISLIKDAFKNVQNSVTDWGNALVEVGSAFTKYVTVPLTAMGGVSVKNFSDWESAFTGVKKTVEGTPEELEAVAKGITDIALSTASSREDVAAVAEAAGQLGIATNDVVDFTKVMVMLGDTTNLAADEAATALARVFNITGEQNFEAIGNAVVHLGNNFATTESEIVHMTNRLAAGGTLAGLTTQEILGLATAMSSVGITAEAGGTAMTQTLTAIEKEFAAFTTGTDNNLARIGEIAGMSADEFAKAWKEKPAQALQAFISGLGDLDEKGESATLVLDELGMAGIRQSNMLKSLGLASGVLADSLNKANQAYIGINENGEEFAALSDEAQKRYGDFAVKIKQLQVSFKLLGAEVGSTIAGMLIPMIEKLKTTLVALAAWWEKLPDSMRKFIIVAGAIAAAIGPVLVIGGKLLIFSQQVMAAGKAMGITAKAVAGIGKTLGGIGLIVGGVATAITNFFSMWNNGWSVAGEVLKDLGIALAAIGAILLGAPALVAGIVAAVVAVVSSLAILIKENWDSIVEFTTRFFEAMKEAWELFSGLVVEIVKYLAEWITQKVIEIKDNVVNYFTQAKDNAVQLFTNLKDGAINLFTNMKTGITNKVGEIKTAIVNGITQAINWIKSLPSQALSWGADIMKSMAQGIRNAMSWVTDAVSNVANRVRSFLHFSEPDIGPLSDFHTYMPDMMKLMAKGINDNAYLVEDALTNVTGMMAGNLEGNEPNNYNYGGVVINMNVPEGADGRMLVDEIESELAARTMRRKAVFG